MAKPVYEVVDGKPTVNWENFVQSEKDRQECLYGETTDKLLELGVFSLNPKKFFISGESICLNPRLRLDGGPVLYFVNKSDAQKYAEIAYSDAMYPVRVYNT